MRYGKVRVVVFTIDQRSHGCMILPWKCIQNIAKEFLLSKKKSIGPEDQNLQAYGCKIKKDVYW